MAVARILSMRVQLIGLGNVARSYIDLLKEKTNTLKSLGIDLKLVSVSDSTGTAVDEEGLDLEKVLTYKDAKWKDFGQYVHGYSALDSIRNVKSDIIVELTPSTQSGEPGLSHVKTALAKGKHVVTANKGPLVVAYRKLVDLARANNVKFLYEATVGAHLPVFCLVDSCFKLDEIIGFEGILNATTNFMLTEMEKGKSFEESLNHAKNAGWAETNCSDDVDGIDAARKAVILANSFLEGNLRLEEVRVKGIRDIEDVVKKRRGMQCRTKLVCRVLRDKSGLQAYVVPRLVAAEDPLGTVNGADMGLKLFFETSQIVFMSVRFAGPKQTALAVLNDTVKVSQSILAC